MTGTATGEREVRLGGAEISDCVCQSLHVRSDQLTDDLRPAVLLCADFRCMCSCFWALWGPVGAQCEATVSWMKREFAPLLDI